MEKKQPSTTSCPIDYRAIGIVDADTIEFAKKLEVAFNSLAQGGFTIIEQVYRETDHGMVVVGQRYTPPEPGPCTRGDGDIGVPACNTKH